MAGTHLTSLPTTAPAGTLTNTVYPCEQVSPLRGIDGQVVEVTGFTGSYVEVVPDAPLDVAMSFYDAKCRLLPERIDLADGYDDSFDSAPTGGVERGTYRMTRPSR